MEFSERLKKLRKDAGLTQVDVASKLGISQPAYASWERGVKKPTQENLVKLSKILYVSVDYLLGNTENKQTSDVLEDIEVLFHINSKGLTEEEKKTFRNDLIKFMEERKSIFKKDGKLKQ